MRLPPSSPIPDLARAIRDAGGRLVVVGGWVRDALMGVPSHDFDLEVFGLDREQVTEIVAARGFTSLVGRQFPVWKHQRAGIDLAFPRAGEDLFEAADPKSLLRAVHEAARHRDLTLNAIAWDPLDDRLLDPLGGAADVAGRVLRAADPATFGVDPLRVLRVARLSARFGAQPDGDLAAICRRLDLAGLPVERIAHELSRMLLDLERPSAAFECLAALGQLDVFAPLAALDGVAQDPVWHPEGDVWTHTRMVVDRAAEIARGLDPKAAEILLFAALCHDLGKPETTSIEGDRIRSLGHEARSAVIAREWPAQFVAQGAGRRAYRRLARKLNAQGLTLVDLERVARADHLGRTTEEARSGRFEAGQIFLERAAEAHVARGVRRDAVSASLVMRSGIPAGPRLGRILARCRELQDERDGGSAEEILEAALRSEAASRD